jgi:hypothetical protein
MNTEIKHVMDDEGRKALPEKSKPKTQTKAKTPGKTTVKIVAKPAAKTKAGVLVKRKTTKK